MGEKHCPQTSSEEHHLKLDPSEYENSYLPCRWAWNLAEKDSQGFVSRSNLCSVISKYTAYVDAHPHLEQLVEECDVNHDGIMDEFEMKTLLEVCYRGMLVRISRSSMYDAFL